MTRLPDLVGDSNLETHFVSDNSLETIHIYHESDPTSRRRVVARSEHWKRLRRIGGGGYSTVWLEECSQGSRNGIKVRAVKQIETGGRFNRIDFNRELETIAKFSHPRYQRCFVESFGWYQSPEHLWIAMEYLELGDLLDYMDDRPRIPESEAQEITFQILEGLEMMHRNEFAHRDLKPKNILIKSQPPERWWIKIADFGISKRISESSAFSTTLKGTPGFIAPELYGFINYGSAYATDIWSLGEISFQMLTKTPTFKPIARLSLYAHGREEFPMSVLQDTGVSKPGMDFVRLLMAPEPDSRLTSEQAIQHPWIKHLSEMPLLPRAPALFESLVLAEAAPIQPMETARGNADEGEESSTVRPSEEVRNQTPGQRKYQHAIQSQRAAEGEACHEAGTSESQSSLPRQGNALSIRSTNSKQESSDAMSFSQPTPSSEEYSEQWWTNHLKKAGLVSSDSKEEAVVQASNGKETSIIKRSAYNPFGLLSDLVNGLHQHRVVNETNIIPADGSLKQGSFQGDLIDLAGRKRNDNTKSHQVENQERPSHSSNQENDVRYLADSLMSCPGLPDGHEHNLGDLVSSHTARPSFKHSHSADGAGRSLLSLPIDEFAHASTPDPRVNPQKHTRSRTHSNDLKAGPSQQETEDESRDPSRGIVALPLIRTDDDAHGRSLMGFKRTSIGANGVVDRIAAGLRFRGSTILNEKRFLPHSDDIKFQFSLHVGAKHRRQISFCPRNLRLVTASGEPNGVEFWDVSSRRRLFAESLFKSNSRITISSTGNLFAATSGDRLTIWNSLDGSSTNITSTEDLRNPQFSHDSSLLAAMSKQKKLHLWRVRYTEKDFCAVKLEKHRTLCFDDHVIAFAFQMKRDRIAVTLNNAIKIRGVSDSQDDIDGTYHFDPSVMGKSFKPKKSNIDRGLVAAISANGRVAAQSEPDGIIGSILFIRDLTNRADNRSHKFLVSPVIQNMVFSSGGEILATSTKNRDVILWDVFGGSNYLAWRTVTRVQLLECFSRIKVIFLPLVPAAKILSFGGRIAVLSI
ncbi:Tetratricopeptide-like helical [Penicillium hetheringtonii]|uniref:Serine/threonine-protein kinase ATG1 n=1 Tax=Penicillium hetheringtonii TaxID=911720 RepID=A0AAD6DCL4_9EURO|nr:Tetratricopeptide-like helical [Penicillium hetheringtonii]